MTKSFVRTAWRVSTALLIVVAIGCKKKEEAPPPDTSATAPAPPPGPPALMVIGVDLGKSLGPDKKVASPTATFGRRDTIYASVSTVGVGSDAKLTAKWVFQTGQVVDSSVQTIAPTGPAQTEFHIVKPGGWPVGKYTVEILLNGTSTNTKQFEVVK